MSVVNAFIFPDRALVGVDSEGATAEGEYKAVSKIFAIPHIAAVCAWRGAFAFGMFASGALLSVGGTFDELVEALPQAAAGAQRMLEKAAGQPGNALSGAILDPRSQIILVGWSESRGRMFGVSVVRDPESGEFVTKYDFDTFTAPHFGDGELEPPKLDIRLDREGMVALIGRQIMLVRERIEWPSAAGGHVILAEVSKDRVEMTRGGAFPRVLVT